MPDVSGSLAGAAENLWGSVGGLVPAGSLGDAIGGVLKLPAALLYGLANLFWGFGSTAPAAPLI